MPPSGAGPLPVLGSFVVGRTDEVRVGAATSPRTLRTGVAVETGAVAMVAGVDVAFARAVAVAVFGIGVDVAEGVGDEVGVAVEVDV